jgi:hypothetical protein
MPTIDPKVQFCVAQYDSMFAVRSPFNADWQDIRTFVRPITVAFNPTTGQFQTVRTDTMFDGTAPEALEQLGSALHSFLTSPAERWFEIQIEGMSKDDLMDNSEILDWLDKVSEIIYAYYTRESANFNLAMHECYLDIGSYGTACINQEWDNDLQGIIFSSKPLQFCYFKENSKGRVDTVIFKYDWTIRQCMQEFGQVLPPKLMEKAGNLENRVEVLHCVFPRTDRVKGNMLPQNMAFASMWVCLTTKELLKESGYETLPYHVGRWMKLAGETYGRGPAKKCLQDIKMLNAMERTILKAGQKAVDPPLVLANEGFMLPIRTSPGALIYKEDEERKIEPLKFEGNLPWAEEKATQKREFIEKCFYADLIRRSQKKAEQTAFEVSDERDEMLRLLAPILGRLLTEIHSPMIARSYHLLNSRGKIPLAPAVLQRSKLSVGYLSTAAVAQLGAKAFTISRFFNDLTPMAQVNPGIFDIVDFDAVAQELAYARRVPRRVIRDQKAVDQLRDQKNKMQAAQQIAQTAEPASQAVKNLADANKSGGLPSIPGM